MTIPRAAIKGENRWNAENVWRGENERRSGLCLFSNSMWHYQRMEHTCETWIRAYFGAVLALTLTLPIEAAAQDGTLAIPRDQADCLAGLTGLETQLTTDPVILKLASCPDVVAGARDLMAASQNASPGIVTPRTGEGSAILILTRREIACAIAQIRAEQEAGGTSDPVSIDLSRCHAG